MYLMLRMGLTTIAILQYMYKTLSIDFSVVSLTEGLINSPSLSLSRTHAHTHRQDTPSSPIDFPKTVWCSFLPRTRQRCLALLTSFRKQRYDPHSNPPPRVLLKALFKERQQNGSLAHRLRHLLQRKSTGRASV